MKYTQKYEDIGLTIMLHHDLDQLPSIELLYAGCAYNNIPMHSLYKLVLYV